MKCCFPFKKKSQSQNRKPLPESRNQSSKSDDSAANSGIKLGRDDSAANSGIKLGRDDSEISPLSKLEMYNEEARNLRVFSLSELRTATNNFDESQKIGKGGFGIVFRGSVMPPNGQGEPTVVAIKSLGKVGFQGHKQWLAEVKFFSIVNHPNLVKLLGHCSQDEESVSGGSGILRLLVCEFMPNKSLEDHLFSKPSATLPWKTRLEIMLGAAQGLAYLHEGLKIQVIYRDFKSSNVLLDENFKPKLSDFGLATEGPIGDRAHVSIEVFTTLGYAAPEYIDTGHLTIKSDIYSFGVVLFEILTGRRTVDKYRPPNEQKLLDWVKQYPADSERFGLIIDPRLGNKYSLTAAQKIAELANTCLARNQRDRPKMSQVVKFLRQAIENSKEGSSDSCVIGL